MIAVTGDQYRILQFGIVAWRMRQQAAAGAAGKAMRFLACCTFCFTGKGNSTGQAAQIETGFCYSPCSSPEMLVLRPKL